MDLDIKFIIIVQGSTLLITLAWIYFQPPFRAAGLEILRLLHLPLSNKLSRFLVFILCIFQKGLSIDVLTFKGGFKFDSLRRPCTVKYEYYRWEQGILEASHGSGSPKCLKFSGKLSVWLHKVS